MDSSFVAGDESFSIIPPLILKLEGKLQQASMLSPEMDSILGLIGDQAGDDKICNRSAYPMFAGEVSLFYGLLTS